MTCGAIQSRLPALAGGDLDREASRQCGEHLATCAACSQRYAELQATLRLLHSVGASEQPPRGFAADLHRRLSAEPAPAPSLLSRLWQLAATLHMDSAPRLAMAAVAVVVLLAVPIALRGRAPKGGPAGSGGSGAALSDTMGHEVAAAFRVPAQRTAVLRFDFVADVEVPDVEFEVSLPSELYFIDGSEPVPEKRLVWRGSLSSGSNPIPLAVRGSKPGRYRVTAHARGTGVDVQHDILIEVVRS